MPESERSRQFLDQGLMKEGVVLDAVRADATTYVRRRAVDEVEVQIFLAMLGIDEKALAEPEETDVRHRQAVLQQRRDAHSRRQAIA